MKYLCVDYGTKRVGVAISDDDGKIAFPKKVFINDQKLIRNIFRLIQEESITGLVVGESLNKEGEKNLLEDKIEKFIEDLSEGINLPIAREKEFFTSFEAHTREGKERFSDRLGKKEKTENLDAKAAAVILQRYLDKINK